MKKPITQDKKPNQYINQDTVPSYPSYQPQSQQPTSVNGFDPGEFTYNRKQSPETSQQFEGFSPANKAAIEKSSRIFKNKKSKGIFNFGSNKACNVDVDQYLNNVKSDNFNEAQGTYKKCCTNYFGNAKNCNLLKDDIKNFDKHYTQPVEVSDEDMEKTPYLNSEIGDEEIGHEEIGDAIRY
jgi:hypothetical protein